MHKIAFIVEGMWHAAGMERVLAARANAMCDELDITFISLDDGSRPDSFPLDGKIRRVYLDAKDRSDCHAKLERYLADHPQDISVSTGGMEFYVLHKIKDGSRKLFEFHFSFDISRVWMGQTMSGVKLWLYSTLQTLRRVSIARHYDHVVVLCKADERKWKRHISQVSCIYNPLTINATGQSSCTNRKAIAVGRLHLQKGFDYLIDAWKMVAERHPDWALEIYGDGDLRNDLQAQIDRNGLTEVVKLMGSTRDIVSKYIDSSVFVLSSRDEAFGLVITEAEACGLPVVAFDCPSAPRELVEEGKNGFVVPLGDTRAMADRICRIIENDEMRQTFGSASVEFAKRFSIDTIKQQWMELYQRVLK